MKIKPSLEPPSALNKIDPVLPPAQTGFSFDSTVTCTTIAIKLNLIMIINYF